MQIPTWIIYNEEHGHAQWVTSYHGNHLGELVCLTSHGLHMMLVGLGNVACTGLIIVKWKSHIANVMAVDVDVPHCTLYTTPPLLALPCKQSLASWVTTSHVKCNRRVTQQHAEKWGVVEIPTIKPCKPTKLPSNLSQAAPHLNCMLDRYVTGNPIAKVCN